MSHGKYRIQMPSGMEPFYAHVTELIRDPSTNVSSEKRRQVETDQEIEATEHTYAVIPPYILQDAKSSQALQLQARVPYFPLYSGQCANVSYEPAESRPAAPTPSAPSEWDRYRARIEAALQPLAAGHHAQLEPALKKKVEELAGEMAGTLKWIDNNAASSDAGDVRSYLDRKLKSFELRADTLSAALHVLSADEQRRQEALRADDSVAADLTRMNQQLMSEAAASTK